MIPLLNLNAVTLAAIMGINNSDANINCVSDVKRSDLISQIFINTEEVEPGTICYVAEESAEAIQKLGWNVEKNETGYFYRTTKTKQKILSVSLSNKGLDELREKIVAIENTAITKQAFSLDPDPLYMNNAALGYIRSFNKNYVNDGYKFAWLATAGSIDKTLNQFADNIKGCENYFSNFISNNDYCRAYHTSESNPHANERKSNDEFNYFVDPITGRHRIDLIHMFASMDACYDWTLFDGAKRIYVPCVYPELLHDLASWGGDLQQAVHALQSRIDDKEDEFTLAKLDKYNFKTIMLGDYDCSESDIIADIDAVNITDLYLNGPGRTSDSLASYYGSTYSDESRFSKFIDAVLNDKNKQWVGERNERFKKEVYDVLGLSIVNGECVDSDQYLSSLTIWKEKFKIMRESNEEKLEPTKEVRKAVADKFCDFIFSIC